jgi:hypothetical protein
MTSQREMRYPKSRYIQFLKILLSRPEQTQRFEVSQTDMISIMEISPLACNEIAIYWIEKGAIEEKRTGNGYVDYSLLPDGFRYLSKSRRQKNWILILTLFILLLCVWVASQQ